MAQKQQNSPIAALDAIDRRILQCLVEDGRMSTLEVAERVGLSATPCSRRIRQLEEAGVISGYTARIDPAALGLGLCVVIAVKLTAHGPDGNRRFLSAIAERAEVSECLLVTGASDYLLRVWVKDVEALRLFITDGLQQIPTVAETATMLVLEQVSNPLAGRR